MINILYLHAGAELYGADIVMLELLKNLNKDKFKPYVILPSNGPLVKELNENNIEVEVIEYPILRRKYFNPVGLVKYIIDYIKYTKKLKKIAIDKNIDIVHSNTLAVLEGVYLKRTLDIKHIWHIHEIIIKPAIIHKSLSFLVSKNSDKVITVSNAVKKHLYDTGYFDNTDIRIIYNGVDEKFNKENDSSYLMKEFNIPNDAIVVGMIGRINSWKGQGDFIDAIERVLEKNINTYAMIVGGVFEGEEWRIDELKNRISKIKDKNRIIFTEYRKDSQNIHSLYDIFVLPSINPDPLPTVVLEAMASSTPIVGYRHGGICEMVQENYNGFLVDIRNIEDLASKINYLIENPNIRKKMGENSLKRQKELFSIKNYVENFEGIYSIKSIDRDVLK